MAWIWDKDRKTYVQIKETQTAEEQAKAEKAYAKQQGQARYARERREEPVRLSDLSHAGDTFMSETGFVNFTEGIEPTAPATPSFDKNTPSSLKQLRWAIYEAVDHYPSKIKTMGSLKMEIEALFKEYTNS